MLWISGNWPELGSVAGKACLMFLAALIGLRLGERRTLAQLSIIDFVIAVAIGAIIGRTAIASTQSFVTGAVALLTLIVVHRLASLLRFNATLGKLFDHPVRVLVEHGQLRHGQLRRCGLTDNDLLAQLRQSGIRNLDEIRYVLYEIKAGLTVVHEDGEADADLVQAALQDSVGFYRPQR
jgi:uncharacterized membrane protein YcaP (DUF421 family)